jgi:SAM-dependent methyltransferase
MSERRAAEEMPAEDWAGEMGDKWLANIDRFESMIAPVGAALIQHAAFQPGERVVDIGCGGGVTTIEIGQAVTPGGEALGLDISPQLIGEAERRARAAGSANVRFQVGDAAVAVAEGGPFDRLVSRFGSMFFTEPPAAFANLRRMLRSGGRMDLSVWAPPSENLWIGAMMAIVGRYLDLPAPEPHAPGPFALDDPDYVRPLLANAGFTGISLTLWRGDQYIGGKGANAESAVDFALNALPFGEALAERSPEMAAQARAELVALFAEHETSEGTPMPGAAWLVSAHVA